LKVAAVVLAAGASTRLGEAKQLAEVGGERLLQRVVVLGARAEAVRAACALDGASVVVNESWSEGMASSVRTGVAAAGDDLDGWVLMTCDQPAVTAEHLRALIAAAAETVASRYGGKLGVPAFFPAARRGELMALRGDAGARGLLKGAREVELAGGELDVDTAESLAEARQRFG
jgi:molybdenum cofactor cytidylyltransferase